jgi:glucose uptake protein
MWKPTEYPQAFLMLLCSMLCWGSWANALKLMKTCRFELFYWDYVFGTSIMSVILGLTMGSFGQSGPTLFSDFQRASATSFEYAFAGGAVFNVANILLTGAIEVAGLAVAFPLGVGLSIVIGVILNYWITPRNNPILLFGGVALLLIAIVLDAMAYRYHSADSRKPTTVGLVLCMISGAGLGLFYPLVAKSLAVPEHLGPYSVGIVFMAGMLVCNLVANTAIMMKPVTGQPSLPLASYFRMPRRWHFLGLTLGGAVWGLGTVFNFVASSTPLVGPATSFALGDGATMVSAIWGVVVWKEFAGAGSNVKRLVVLMFLFFVLGLGSIALSPVISVGTNSP